jgi:hypothetical protein
MSCNADELLRKANVTHLEGLLGARRADGINSERTAIIKAALQAPDDEALLSELEKTTAAVKARSGPPEDAIRAVGPDDVLAPLPPTRWVCEGLHLCPGRPAMLAGYGFSGKTMAAQSLALSIASRRAVWGWFMPSREGHVLHIDYEQGRHASFKRYQRLARGLGVSRLELGDRLHVAVNPGVYLTDIDAESAFARACEGMDLCIVDSLRAAAPGADENESKVRACVDLLLRVSEKTGTAFLVIHHAGKGPQRRQLGGGGGSDDPEADLRRILGRSSAIFDACGSVLVMIAGKGEDAAKQSKRVYQAKGAAEAEGHAAESFYLGIEDVELDGNPRAGVRLAYKTIQQVNPPTGGSEVLEESVRKVVETVNRHAGRHGIQGKEAMRALACLGAAPCRAAIDAALGRGLIRNAGTASRHIYFPVDGAAEGDGA